MNVSLCVTQDAVGVAGEAAHIVQLDSLDDESPVIRGACVAREVLMTGPRHRGNRIPQAPAREHCPPSLFYRQVHR